MQKTEPLSDQYFGKKRKEYKKSAKLYAISAIAFWVGYLIFEFAGVTGVTNTDTLFVVGNIFLILSIIYSLHQDRLRENQKICNLLEEIKRDGDIQL